MQDPTSASAPATTTASPRFDSGSSVSPPSNVDVLSYVISHNGLSSGAPNNAGFSADSGFGGAYEYDDRKNNGRIASLALTKDPKLLVLIAMIRASDGTQKLIKDMVTDSISKERIVKEKRLFGKETVTQRQERHIYGYITAGASAVLLRIPPVLSGWYEEGGTAGAPFRTSKNMPPDAVPFVIHTHAWDSALSSGDFRTSTFPKSGAYVIGIEAPSGTVMVLSPNKGTLYEGSLSDFGIQ
jgi:hypothetical protein